MLACAHCDYVPDEDALIHGINEGHCPKCGGEWYEETFWECVTCGYTVEDGDLDNGFTCPKCDDNEVSSDDAHAGDECDHWFDQDDECERCGAFRD